MSKEKFCVNCEAKIKPTNTTGYCVSCFEKNVNNVKSKYHHNMHKKYIKTVDFWRKKGVKITQEQLDKHFQINFCQMCGVKIKSKQLDHDHTTGYYRGTLCKLCNNGLGKLGDDLDVVIGRVMKYKMLSKENEFKINNKR